MSEHREHKPVGRYGYCEECFSNSLPANYIKNIPAQVVADDKEREIVFLVRDSQAECCHSFRHNGDGLYNDCYYCGLNYHLSKAIIEIYGKKP